MKFNEWHWFLFLLLNCVSNLERALPRPEILRETIAERTPEVRRLP